MEDVCETIRPMAKRNNTVENRQHQRLDSCQNPDIEKDKGV